MDNNLPPKEKSTITPGYAEKTKKSTSSRNYLETTIKKRNMTLLLFSPNEIAMLKDIYNNIQSSMNFVWFFAGVGFTILITRLSMSEEQYKTTPISYTFWWIMGISTFFCIKYGWKAYKESNKENAMMENIKKEMADED